MTDSYKFVKIETLVPAERALFDPSLALPPEARHLPAPEVTGTDLALWAVLGGGGALAALVFGAWFLDDMRSTNVTRTSSETSSSFLAYAVIGAALAVGSVFGAIAGLRRMFEQARGVPNRYGMFLLADALLVRTSRDSVTRIPRTAVKAASFTDEKRQDGTTFRHADVHYSTEAGEAATVRIDSELASDDARPAVVATLQEWSQARG